MPSRELKHICDLSFSLCPPRLEHDKCIFIKVTKVVMMHSRELKHICDLSFSSMATEIGA